MSSPDTAAAITESRTTAFVATVVVLVVAAVAAGVFLILGTDSGPEQVVSATDTEDSDPSDGTPADSDVDSVVGELPEITYELLLTRDPFDPVRPEPDPVAPTDPDDPTAPTGPGTPTDPDAPTDPGTPVTPVDPDDPGGVDRPVDPLDPCQPDGAVMVCDGVTVSVLEVGDARARVRVGDVVYEPAVGQMFADDFLLVSVGAGCAVIRYDDRQSFRLCPPESTFK